MTDNRQQTTDLRPKTKIEPRILNGEAGVLWRVTKHKPVLSAVEGLRTGAGSALILAVVLTSLLAVLGMMFVMVARVDRIATSAISENKDLDSAVEAVIAKISQELVLDVPGVSTTNQEYYDYPDANNAWLASLEPHKDGGDKWRQISDVYNRLGGNLELDVEIIPDYQDSSEVREGSKADADGDGVADSKWVELDDISSNKGRAIYAAIRIIDNGAMLNVNTAYKFDPNSAVENEIDGSSQMQINLMALSWRPAVNPYESLAETDLLKARANNGSGGLDPLDLDEYEKNVIWRYNEPDGPYTPFDISDELELRYRFLVNQEDIDTRLEELGAAQGRTWEFRTIYAFRRPAEVGELGEWFISAYDDGSLDPNYAYRHIGTTYNMDRIIRPDGRKMLNINDPCVSVGSVYETVKTALGSTDPNFGDVNDIAAQMAVNLIDFRDENSDVETFRPDVNSPMYYGFESPCIYISELAHKFVPIDPMQPNSPIAESYAIELYRPYPEDDDPCGWRLQVNNTTVEGPINWSIGSKSFHVILFEDPCMPPARSLGNEVDFNEPADPNYNHQPYNADHALRFHKGSIIELQRRVGGVYITVDYQEVPVAAGGGWMDRLHSSALSIHRDINPHQCIKRLWDSVAAASTLGRDNSYSAGGEPIQAHPANRPFTNIGEIGMIFREDVYSDIVRGAVESDIRLNLADSDYHNLFKYLTVFDPADHGADPNETRIKGRININTAPWYVIAQLPWMTPEIAQATVAYRDKDSVSGDPNYSGRTGERGFRSIGELNRVVRGNDDYRIDYYALDSNDLTGFPDLTTPDHPLGSAIDDFEERDVIFARISNLVTVRSDVFTAYILVRVGADGPQKRAIAILDRSDVYPPDGGKVRIVALHPVPDPR